MPVYEFYCKACNTIFNFYSSRVNTEKRPQCPKCGQGPLGRVISQFGILRGRHQDEDVLSGLDESKLTRAMSILEKETGSLNPDDPRQAAQLMRKLCDTTGLNLKPGMEKILQRLETGEDPAQIEAQMGDALDEDDIFELSRRVSQKKTKKSPERDEKLYPL
jgi:putative FmdB family regulatory protein